MDTPETCHETVPTPEEALVVRQQMADLLDDHDEFGPLTGNDSYSRKMRDDNSIQEERLRVKSGEDYLEIIRRQHWGDELLVPAYVEVITTTADMLGQSRAMLMVEQILTPEGQPVGTKIISAEYRDTMAPDKSHLDGKVTREGLEMATMTIDMTIEELRRKRIGFTPAN